jgi:hypothetical protein
VRLFGHIPQRGLVRWEIREDIAAVESHAPVRRPHQSGQDFDRRALARAVWTEEAQHLALMDLK